MWGMGRETKILLGLLGMLAFVFLGALLARLFIARPPVGLGVDVHTNLAASGPATIVQPPELGRPSRSAFSAASPVDADGSEPWPSNAVRPEPGNADRGGAETANRGISEPGIAADSGTEAGGSAVVPAAFEESEPPKPAEGLRPHAMAVDREVRQGSRLVIVEGDSWWNLAEAAYGDGRWYRSLYAWNRAIDSAVSLRPGTTLVVPTVAELSAGYPGLVPGRPGLLPLPAGGIDFR
jgi:nucleoid-associated protein YgaU